MAIGWVDCYGILTVILSVGKSIAARLYVPEFESIVNFNTAKTRIVTHSIDAGVANIKNTLQNAPDEGVSVRFVGIAEGFENGENGGN
jgi:hypothetical protein